MKKYFITGLVLLLPIAVTISLLIFFFNFLTEPFAGMIAGVFDYYDLLESDFLFVKGHEIQFFISQILILAIFFFLTVLIGWVARYFFINCFFSLWEKLLHKIPLVRSIYKASQEVITTLFSSNSNTFKQVVLVPFPSQETMAIGLITQENLSAISKELDSDKVTVFLPTAPNPTSGFLMIYSKSEITYIDMKVEDAFKFLISCGVVTPSQEGK